MDNTVLHIYDPRYSVDVHSVRTRRGLVTLHLTRETSTTDIVTVGPDGPTGQIMCATECGCP